MGASGAILYGGSAIVGAYSQYQAGKMSDRLSGMNASISEFQAKDALDRGLVESQRVLKKGARMVGTQRAGYAGQGVDVNEGTAAAIQLETKQMSAMDALTVRNNAHLEAWGFKVQAQESRFQGAMARMEGKQQAIGTLLTGASQAATSYASWQANRPAKPTAMQQWRDDYSIQKTPKGSG